FSNTRSLDLISIAVMTPPASYLFLPKRRQPPPTSTLFPYTTLFRSAAQGHTRRGRLSGPGARGRDGAGGLLRRRGGGRSPPAPRSEEHTSELQSLAYLVCRLLLEKKKQSSKYGMLALLAIGSAHDCT